MYLRTLGGLQLEGASFGRPKPLFLLAYLALEGAKERRYLAELFWLGAANPRRSLNTALHQLRTGAPGAVVTDDARIGSGLGCDAEEFLSAADRGEGSWASELYQGPFLSGIDLDDLGVELEEWIYGTREFLAARARTTLLALAGESALRGDYQEAAAKAQEAYVVPGASLAEPEELTTIYRLLVAGGSPRASQLKKEASDYGLEVDLTPETARTELRQVTPVERSIPNNLPIEVSVECNQNPWKGVVQAAKGRNCISAGWGVLAVG